METMTLTITAATLQAIGAGLNELPYKIAAPAMKEIDEQVRAHVAMRDRLSNKTPAPDASPPHVPSGLNGAEVAVS